MAEPPNKGDRKVDIEKLKLFCRMKPTLQDCATFFECSKRTIELLIKEKEDLAFTQFRDKYMVHTRSALVQKAINMALSGNTAMMIFCLKNLCGWVDRATISVDELKPFKLAYDIRAAQSNEPRQIDTKPS